MLGKGILWISALLFTGYGMVSFFAPGIPTDFAGLAIMNGDGRAEIGAMYGGLQTGIALDATDISGYRQVDLLEGLYLLRFMLRERLNIN